MVSAKTSYLAVSASRATTARMESARKKNAWGLSRIQHVTQTPIVIPGFTADNRPIGHSRRFAQGLRRSMNFVIMTINARTTNSAGIQTLKIENRG